MADRKISDLTALTAPAAGDFLPIVDISESLVANKNKRITIEELLRGAPDGTAAAPSIAFESDGGNGFYLAGTDSIGASTNGVNRLTLSTTAFTSTLPFVAPLGAAATPSLAFTGDLNTGIYSPGADQVAISTNGTGRLTVDTAATTSTLPVVHPLGAVGTPSITFTSDLNTGFWSPTADTLAASTAGIERLRITAGGLIGAGTSSPSGAFHVKGSTPQLWLEDTGAGPGGKFRAIGSNNGSLTFIRYLDNGTLFGENGRFDDQGRLLVGTSSARDNFYNSTISAQFQVEGSSTTKRIISLISSASAGAGGPAFIFGKQNSGAVGGNTVVASADNLGNISFQGNDGTDFVEAASITAFVDGTPGANDMPGRLVFSTTSDNASSPTERMRLTSAGLLGIGTTSPGTYNANLAIYSAGGAFVGALHANASGTFPKASAISLGSDAVSYTYTTGGTTVALSGSAHIAALQSASSGAGTDIAFINTSGGSVSEKARIDSSGRLLVGTSTALDNFSRLQITDITGLGITLAHFTNTTSAGSLQLYKSRSGTVGTNTIVQNGDQLGRIDFRGADGSGYITGALISGQVDGTPGANDMPGRLVFSVTADGSASPTEALRISNDRSITVSDGGNVVLGTTTGTKIGTATTQKLGFYNATPVVQPAAVADATTAIDVITQLNDLLAKLRTLGIIAT